MKWGARYLTEGTVLKPEGSSWTLLGPAAEAMSDEEALALRGQSVKLALKTAELVSAYVSNVQIPKSIEGTRRIVLEFSWWPGTLAELEGAELLTTKTPKRWPVHAHPPEPWRPAEVIEAPVRLGISLAAAREMALAGKFASDGLDLDFESSDYDALFITSLARFKGRRRWGAPVRDQYESDGYGVEMIVQEARALATSTPQALTPRGSVVFLDYGQFDMRATFDDAGDAWVSMGEPKFCKTIVQSARLRFTYQQYVSLFVSMAIPIVEALRE